MVIVDASKCTGCGLCAENCPLEAVRVVEKKAVVDLSCVHCGVCLRLCKAEALAIPEEKKTEAATCTACPVRCVIEPGFFGACRRYVNSNGKLLRDRPLVRKAPFALQREKAIERPLITAVGAGTAYPCCRPAPYIVAGIVDGVEVVTVVTEAPLSYSGVKLKIDTNFYIGEEGARVRRKGRAVGRVETEEYGAKMLSIGGANLLTGENGFLVARTIVEICNGERVTLKVENGAMLELQVGKRPVINGIEDTKMRVGCGSATVAMFAAELAAAVDEAIVLDHHVIGLLSEHPAGEYVGMKKSGIIPKAKRSTRGRYFGQRGPGWGGTNIMQPREAVLKIDREVARPGMKLLVTETTGQKAALFKVTENYELAEIPLSPEVEKAVAFICSSCQEARVSALYTGGTGGSARAGVTRYPLKLTEAVHKGEAVLTIGGAPAFVLPGGGINFMVDVEKVVPKAFTWVPTPATVAPVEYTVAKDKYIEMGGHAEHIISLSALKKVKGNAPQA